MRFVDRLKSGWNVFRLGNDQDSSVAYSAPGPMVSYNQGPTRSRNIISTERSILAAIYNRIALDAASIPVRHVRTDKKGRYLEDIDSGLNNCLNLEANIDQSGFALRQDIFMSLLEEGVIALVPVDTDLHPFKTSSIDVRTMRVGTITAWYPRHVTVNLYNDKTGFREDVTLPKETVVIIENPKYTIMNEPNSTYQRLVRKLHMLDAIDEQTASGKMDIIIQLPYVIKNERKQEEARIRTESIETQLKNSKYGVAYIDGTERITQLNRPAENNLLKQVEALNEMLYDQLGITPEVLNGTANEDVMANYYSRTIEPFLLSLTENIERKLLTKTAKAQNQRIRFFQNPFSLVPASKLAEMADKFTRNEILSSNEIRDELGLEPSDDPRADELINKNLPPYDEVDGGLGEDPGERITNAILNRYER